MTSLGLFCLFLTATSVWAYHSPSSAERFAAAQGDFSNDDDLGSLDGEERGAEGWSTSAGQPIEVDANFRKELKIFCWPGVRKDIRRLWFTAAYELNITDDSFHLYKGATVEEVENQKKAAHRWFAFLPWRDRNIRLASFSQTCIGVFTKEAYQLYVRTNRIDPFRLGMFIAGLCLMLFARKMSRNTVFHYGSGISIALVGSLLVLIYVISRMIPRKAAGVSFLVGGWAVVLYFLRTMWANFWETLSEHRQYAAAYVAAVSALTFLGIYRYGGVTNPRTMDVLQWIMQAVGAALIYLSCTIELAGIILVIFVGGLDVLLHSGYAFRRFRLVNWLFPPRPRKLISQAEFDAIGRRETEKALRELRQYCNSPGAKPWSLVKKVRNPSRLSDFVDEGTHLIPDEVDSYLQHLTFDGADEDDDVSQDEEESSPVSPQWANGNSGGRSNGSPSAKRTFADRFGGRGAFMHGSYSRNSPSLGNRSDRSSNVSTHDFEPMDFE
ncbi:putative Nuclear envelope integral membrane protein 1 [Hypsibius exemplaris]|uniref:Nuclear envelope integral membrane protein 1 n=1 Tax=Hypsibius exemplaris TaxID=2072580 RepID=A0A1W0X0P6_HYPEX|nr:putative Nuclear envelope integral membrane protein 1 [Hypsibius exemplaris]